MAQLKTPRPSSSRGPGGIRAAAGALGDAARDPLLHFLILALIVALATAARDTGHAAQGPDDVSYQDEP